MMRLVLLTVALLGSAFCDEADDMGNQMFDMLDTDKDGLLTTKEFAVLHQMAKQQDDSGHVAQNPQQEAENFKAMDRNGDRRVSRGELIAWLSLKASQALADVGVTPIREEL